MLAGNHAQLECNNWGLFSSYLSARLVSIYGKGYWSLSFAATGHFLDSITLILNVEPFKENVVTIKYDDAESNNSKNGRCG